MQDGAWLAGQHFAEKRAWRIPSQTEVRDLKCHLLSCINKTIVYKTQEYLFSYYVGESLGEGLHLMQGSISELGGFWILKHWYTFLVLQGVHCSSDLPSSFRDALAFTSVSATSKSLLFAAEGCSEEWAGRQLQVSSCFLHVSMSKPMSPIPIKKKYSSRQYFTCF